jgi:hypothetical protein
LYLFCWKNVLRGENFFLYGFFVLFRWEILLYGKGIKRTKYRLITWGMLGTELFEHLNTQKCLKQCRFKRVSLEHVIKSMNCIELKQSSPATHHGGAFRGEEV